MENNNGIFQAAEIENEPWYREALDRDGELYWFTDDSDPNRLYLAKNLRLRDVDKAGGESWRSIGVIRVGFSVDWLMQSAADAGVTEDMAAYITDSEGNILWNNANAGARFSEDDFSEL